MKENNTDLQDGKHCLQGDVMPPCEAFVLPLIQGVAQSDKNTSKFLSIQPASCRTALPKKDMAWDEWHLNKPELIEKFERVLFFDPTEIYDRIHSKIDPYKRHAGLQINDLFPLQEKEDGKCRCGCNVVPKEYMNGKYHMWATHTCQSVASDILSIINNYFQRPAKYITLYYGKQCSECGNAEHGRELDHIVGVKQGGGGGWLSNYRWLCVKCHRNKTNKTFGFKNSNNLKLEL